MFLFKHRGDPDVHSRLTNLLSNLPEGLSEYLAPIIDSL